MELKGKSSNHYFHSFCLYPSFSFETQGNDEKIILVLRSHPVTQIFWVINSVIFVFLLYIFNAYITGILPFTKTQTFFMSIFFGIGIASYAWFHFLSWFYNVGIITDKRVIDIDFHNVIYKEMTEARLQKLEDITSKSGGYIGSLLNYGNIFIQTAGEEVNIEFMNIPNPSGVLYIMNQLLGK